MSKFREILDPDVFMKDVADTLWATVEATDTKSGMSMEDNGYPINFQHYKLDHVPASLDIGQAVTMVAEKSDLKLVAGRTSGGKMLTYKTGDDLLFVHIDNANDGTMTVGHESNNMNVGQYVAQVLDLTYEDGPTEVYDFHDLSAANGQVGLMTLKDRSKSVKIEDIERVIDRYHEITGFERVGRDDSGEGIVYSRSGKEIPNDTRSYIKISHERETIGISAAYFSVDRPNLEDRAA